LSELYVRGATTVDFDESGEVSKETEILLKEILRQNTIGIKEIKFIIFTATSDIKSVYPAVAARNLGIVEAALMCFQEMFVENSAPLCVRVMLCASVNISKSPRHVYLNNAKNLRPDLILSPKKPQVFPGSLEDYKNWKAGSPGNDNANRD
jgi:monofunctional chorismate mutase